MWVETAYWTIVRRGQMESLRMIDEDEWPDAGSLVDYQPIYDPDPNFYHPIDHIVGLGMYLRDHTMKQRKLRVKNKKESERDKRQQHVMF
jgi:hypothetical protein